MKLRRLRVENELRVLTGTADGIRGIASWKSHAQRRFRQSDFRMRHERLFERFVGSVDVRPFRLL